MAIAFTRYDVVTNSGNAFVELTPAGGASASGACIVAAGTFWAGGGTAANEFAAVTSTVAGTTFTPTVKKGTPEPGGGANDGAGAAAWVALNAPSGVHTVRYDHGPSSFWWGHAHYIEFSGVAATAAVDKTASLAGSNYGTGAAPVSVATSVTAQANEVAVAILHAGGNDNGSNTLSGAVTPTGFQNVSREDDTGNEGHGYEIAYKLLSATGPVTADFGSVNDYHEWSALLLTLRDAAGGGTTLTGAVTDTATASETRLPAGIGRVGRSEANGQTEARSASGAGVAVRADAAAGADVRGSVQSIGVSFVDGGAAAESAAGGDFAPSVTSDAAEGSSRLSGPGGAANTADPANEGAPANSDELLAVASASITETVGATDLRSAPTAVAATLSDGASAGEAATAPGNLPIVLIGPTRTYATLQAAINGHGSAPAEFIFDDGQYVGSSHCASIPTTYGGFIVRSASGNPRRCVINFNTNSLAGSQGGFLVRSPGLIKGIGFQGAGDATVTASGKAAVYGRSFTARGTMRVEDCTFDNNTNGIFVQPVSANGGNVVSYIKNCEFGYLSTNGQSSDFGNSHDVYVQGVETTFENCRFWGCERGNSLKSRSPTLSVINCWIASREGRVIDYPEGGTLTVSGGTLAGVQTANSNFFSYATENTNNHNATTTPDPVFTGVHIITVRANTNWWVASAASDVVLQFQNCTQAWGGTNPSITNTGSGGVANLGALVRTPPGGTVLQPIPVPLASIWDANAATDGAKGNDVYGGLATSGNSRSDPSSAADAAPVAAAISPQARSDGNGAAESQSTNLALAASVRDSTSAADIADAAPAVRDSATPADARAAVGTGASSRAEATTSADAASAGQTLPLQTIEASGASDAVASGTVGPLLSTLADGTAPSGFLASTVVFLAVAAETGAASDQISSGSGVTQTRLDTVAASDTLAGIFAASAAAAETVSASDTAFAAGTGRAISADGVAAIETRTAAASTALATTDLVTPSDRAPAPDQSASDQDVQDSAAATDAASSSIIFAVSVTDAAEASDATTNFAAFAALLQETEAAGEAIVVSFSADARHVERGRPLDFRSASALSAADAIASAQPAEAFGHGQALGPGSASLTLIQSRTIALVIEPVRPRA